MTRHFGVLIPSTNTTVEMECRLLPATYQAHIGRLMTSAPGQTWRIPVHNRRQTAGVHDAGRQGLIRR